MVDWRSANVGSAQSGASRSIESHTKKLEGEVHRQHPARVWVGRQERKPPAKEPERMSTTHVCASQLSQLVSELQQDVTGTATEIDWRAADPSRHPQNVCRGLARLLSHGEVSCESARWLAKQIGDRLPPGWGAVWRDKGCSALEGPPTQQLRTLVDFLRDMEIRCARCQGTSEHVGNAT
jgi:hypothetical protein